MDQGSLRRLPSEKDSPKNEAVSPQQTQFLAHQQQQQQEEYYTQYYQPTQAEMQYYYQQQQAYAASNPQQFQQHYQAQQQLQLTNATAQGNKNQVVPGTGSGIHTAGNEKQESLSAGSAIRPISAKPGSQEVKTDPLIPPALQKYISPKQQLFVEKYLCCCCPKRKRQRLLCCGFVVLVIIALAILVYFYLPRFPDIKVFSINISDLANLNTPYSFTYKDPANPNLNELILKMNLSMVVATYNPNLYGLNVDSINLVAQLMVNQTYVYNPLLTTSLLSYGSLVQVIGKTPTPPAGYYGKNDSIIGTASRDAIYFPSKTWVNYSMIFEFTYTPDKNLGVLQDPTILELADSCGITSRYKPAGRAMRIHYVATSSISALKALNYAPSLSNDLFIKCPFSSEQINGVIQEVKDGKSPFDAIKDVFGGSATPTGTTKRGRRSYQEL
ncbi:UNVERIFIED_CONTAM: hypothetical protein HDU68_008411 [Siphonaria sp. JEL0065]|nr:hypothetical protein HDU68_008411 [Siphonaria sp. JEL0065]